MNHIFLVDMTTIALYNILRFRKNLVDLRSYMSNIKSNCDI